MHTEIKSISLIKCTQDGTISGLTFSGMLDIGVTPGLSF